MEIHRNNTQKLGMSHNNQIGKIILKGVEELYGKTNVCFLKLYMDIRLKNICFKYMKKSFNVQLVCLESFQLSRLFVKL